MAILFLVWIMAFVDRQMILLLVPGIKASLHVSDTQVSLLHGLAFSLFFALAGLPGGRLVDRTNRRNLILIGLVGWSVSTIACGLANSFALLFASRLTMGMFQAVLAPASFSIVADLFPAERRGRPIAFLISAAALGSSLSNMIGGVMLQLFNGLPLPILPGFGALEPWQATIILAGLPGLVLAIGVALLPEPSRDRLVSAVGAPVFAITPYLLRHRGLFSLLFVAFACHFILGYGIATWLPALLMRSAGLTPAAAGLAMGSLYLLAALVAGPVGGWASDRLARRDPRGGRLRLERLLLVLQLIVLLPLFLPHNVGVVLAVVGFFAVLNTTGTAVIYAALPDLVPSEGRGRIVAIEQLISSLVGMGLGPTAVALFTDHVLADEGRLNVSMIVVGGGSALIGALLITLALGLLHRRGLGEAVAPAPGNVA